MSFLSRIMGLFRSGPEDPEGWQVGDWAECIVMGQWYAQPSNTPTKGPRHGQMMRVIGVEVVGAPGVGKVLTLTFTGWPDQFEAAGFRKRNPRADAATAAESEFTDLVRRKPAPALPRETIRELQ